MINSYRDLVGSVGYCFHVLLSENDSAGEVGSQFSDVVYLRKSDLEHLWASHSVEGALFAIIRRHFRIERLCPYNTGRAATGSMFKGRDRELGHLVHDLHTHLGNRRSAHRQDILTPAVRAYPET